MASYETYTDSELRKKLLEIGYDIPISVNREFLIKKLKSAQDSSSKNGARRKSVGRSTAVEKEISAAAAAAASSADSSQSQINNSSGGTGSGRKSVRTTKTRHSLALSDISATGSPKLRANNHQQQDMSSNHHASNSLNASRSRVSFNSMSTIGDDDDLSLSTSPLSSTSATLGGGGGGTGPSLRSGNASGGGAGDQSWSKKSSPQDWTRYSSLFPSPISATPPSTFSTTTSSSLSNLNNGSWNNHSLSSNSNSNNSHSALNRLTMSKRASGFPNDVHQVGDRLHASSSPPTDRGHFISSILVAIAVLFFGMIAVLYLNLTYNSGKVPVLGGLSPNEKEYALNGADGGVTYGTPISEPSPVPSLDTLATLSSNYPICGLMGVDSMICIPPDHLKTARTLFSSIKEELVLRAKWKPCSYNTEDRVSLNVAKSLLYHLSDKKKTEVDDCFTSMLILCVENPNWGLKIEKDDSTEVLNARELLELDFTTTRISATNITPSFYCNCLGYVQAVFTYFVLISVAALIIFIAYKGIMRYQQKKKDEANEIFIYVDNILQMLQEQFELAKETGGDSFLAVSHIRDSLVPAKERLSKSALWNKVVDHISNNESRVREEIQHISGEEFRVWRWLPNASPVVSPRSRLSMMMMTPGGSPAMSPSSTPPGGPSCSSNSARPPMGTPCPGASSSKWQGQAFELSDGSPNALPITPTNCLKIRHMFDSDAADDEREVRIQRAILDKCPNSLICHIGVEHGSPEGCVYVKCATKEDARKAYLSLHGWWFDGHLLSVKFLREERYLARFPQAKLANTPLTHRY